jgi:hypothetical protein
VNTGFATPYGFWTSPITSDLVAADSIRLEQVALDVDAIYWSETQPQKQGRTFVYRVRAGGEPERVTPYDAEAFSVSARAHEYGGGSFAVSDGVVYFSNRGCFIISASTSTSSPFAGSVRLTTGHLRMAQHGRTQAAASARHTANAPARRCL